MPPKRERQRRKRRLLADPRERPRSSPRETAPRGRSLPPRDSRSASRARSWRPPEKLVTAARAVRCPASRNHRGSANSNSSTHPDTRSGPSTGSQWPVTPRQCPSTGSRRLRQSLCTIRTNPSTARRPPDSKLELLPAESITSIRSRNPPPKVLARCRYHHRGRSNSTRSLSDGLSGLFLHCPSNSWQ